MQRPLAVLKLDKRIHDVIAFAGHVVQSMTDHPAFPAPTPPLAQVQADLDALARAQSTVLSRTYGAAKARDSAVATVRLHLVGLRSYVQTVADGTDADTAAQLIVSSGLSIKRRGVHPRQRAAAVPGPVSGSVRLTAPFAGKRAAYSWEPERTESAESVEVYGVPRLAPWHAVNTRGIPARGSPFPTRPAPALASTRSLRGARTAFE